MKRKLFSLWIFAVIFIGCSAKPNTLLAAPTETIVQTVHTPTKETNIGLSKAEIDTLKSLEKVDTYPLYVMEYSADYKELISTDSDNVQNYLGVGEESWACTLFAALADEDNRLYGRNFDWEYSPALLLFTDPPGGYASVSMVDMAYLGFSGNEVNRLDEEPIDRRVPLLEALWWPFDGMNEHGLVVGMAAVPSGNMIDDPQKPTLDSLEIIRKILDEARDVDEAVEIFRRYNVDMFYGPDLHYLIADRTGKSVLVEYYNGEIYVLPNEQPWHLATNFLCSPISGPRRGRCWRYDQVLDELEQSGGNLSLDKAMTLLGMVSQAGTQWSVIYEISTGKVNVVMGQEYSNIHTFQLNLSDQ